jgi:hypothetical protein
MALWQATYWLVPLSRSGHDPEGAWLGHSDVSRVLTLVGSVLPRTVSSYQDSLHWGESDSHDVVAFREAGQLASIRVRLDVRSEDLERLIEAFAKIGTAVDAAFADSDGNVIPAAAWALREHIQNSRAARFLTDPVAFLGDSLNRVDQGHPPMTPEDVEQLVLDAIGGDWERANSLWPNIRQRLVRPPRIETYWGATQKD